MTRMPSSLPLDGHALADVQGEGRFILVFDDPAKSRLAIHGPFSIGSGEQRDLYEPPLPDWVRNVLQSLAGVTIESARFNRASHLRIRFADGRELEVPDGPFENWHYSNNQGVVLHGGVGRVA